MQYYVKKMFIIIPLWFCYCWWDVIQIGVSMMIIFTDLY